MLDPDPGPDSIRIRIRNTAFSSLYRRSWVSWPLLSNRSPCLYLLICDGSPHRSQCRPPLYHCSPRCLPVILATRLFSWSAWMSPHLHGGSPHLPDCSLMNLSTCAITCQSVILTDFLFTDCLCANQCCGSGIFIPDPGTDFFHPGTDFFHPGSRIRNFPSRIPDPHQRI